VRKLLLLALPAFALSLLAASLAQGKPALTGSCAKSSLTLIHSGQLTVGTDNPAFPPWFGGDAKKPWKVSDPRSGKGFESAVAFAIGEKLGFAKNKVNWTTEPFNSSYAPGPKSFDFDVNEISITPARAQHVDFSAPYYTANQAVVAAKGSDAANAKSLADLKGASIGVQIGTTSLDAVDSEIQPSSDPRVFNDSNDVVTALKEGQVDAVVTDLPTALYLTAAQVPSATVVGQFSAPGGDQWGALLGRGSPLTSCVSQAIDSLRSSGQLGQINQRWMSQAAKAPVLN
jgi:polar amino acid transport system substrate-binding protein